MCLKQLMDRSPSCLGTQSRRLAPQTDSLTAIMRSCCKPYNCADLELQDVEEWPQRAGANGSLRFPKECSHGCNAGRSLCPNLVASRVEHHDPGRTIRLCCRAVH